MDAITVLIVEDEPLLTQAYTMILEADSGIRVVGTASDGAAGVAEHERLRPDVVLMDLRMPVLNGAEATGRIMREHPEAKVLVVTSMTTEDYLSPALANGAAGYLTKDTDAEGLVRAVRAVEAGTMVLGPSIAREVVDLLLRSGVAPRTDAPASPRDLPEALTPREQDVLELLAEGLTNQEMAARLYVSDSTVKSNLARVMHKLGANNRVQALVLGVRAGLVSIPG